jgi:uroporphyrinogen-III synthase
VVELPLITVTKEIDKDPLADVMLELGSYDWIVFTSANGVRFFFEEFLRIFDDIRALGCCVCRVSGTPRPLRSAGFTSRSNVSPRWRPPTRWPTT